MFGWTSLIFTLSSALFKNGPNLINCVLNYESRRRTGFAPTRSPRLRSTSNQPPICHIKFSSLCMLAHQASALWPFWKALYTEIVFGVRESTLGQGALLLVFSNLPNWFDVFRCRYSYAYEACPDFSSGLHVVQLPP